MSTCIISSGFCPGCKHIFPIKGKSKRDADKICLQCNPGAIPRYITEGREGRGFYRWAICTACYGKITYGNSFDTTTDLTQTIYHDSVKDKRNYWSHCEYSTADLPQSISSLLTPTQSEESFSLTEKVAIGVSFAVLALLAWKG